MKKTYLTILLTIMVSCGGGGGKSSSDDGESLSILNLSFGSSSSEGTDCYEHNASTLTGADCTNVGGTYAGTSVPAVYKCNNSTTNTASCNAQGGVIQDNCTAHGVEWTKVGSVVNASTTKACTDAGGTNFLSCVSVPDSTKCGNLSDGVWTLVSSATTTWSCSGYNLNTQSRCDIAGGTFSGRKRISVSGDSSAHKLKSGSFKVSVIDGSYAVPLENLDSGDTVSKISMFVYLREGGSNYWRTSVTPTFSSTIKAGSGEDYNYIQSTFSKKYTNSTDDRISGDIYIYE